MKAFLFFGQFKNQQLGGILGNTIVVKTSELKKAE